MTEPGTVVHAVDIQGVYSVQAMHCSSQRNLAFVNVSGVGVAFVRVSLRGGGGGACGW